MKKWKKLTKEDWKGYWRVTGHCTLWAYIVILVVVPVLLILKPYQKKKILKELEEELNKLYNRLIRLGTRIR